MLSPASCNSGHPLSETEDGIVMVTHQNGIALALALVIILLTVVAARVVLVQKRTNGATPPQEEAVEKSHVVAVTAMPQHHPTHGTWTAAQHVGKMRTLFSRSFRFAQRHVGAAEASSHLQAMSEVANSGNVMRAVLRFAMPYCTPTRAERRAICTMCNTSDDTAGLARWLNRGVDPNTVNVEGDGLPFIECAPMLYIAARQGHVSLVAGLIRNGAGVDKVVMDDNGE